ncbi:hypothetical protein QLX08_004364 [Tetragonisca angustula]|uniref:Uncharacterized protein n=1 Tax=Tetragonisca angustula TaxID=166442 RepID=A0AAW1A2S3_9HYME
MNASSSSISDHGSSHIGSYECSRHVLNTMTFSMTNPISRDIDDTESASEDFSIQLLIQQSSTHIYQRDVLIVALTVLYVYQYVPSVQISDILPNSITIHSIILTNKVQWHYLDKLSYNQVLHFRATFGRQNCTTVRPAVLVESK